MTSEIKVGISGRESFSFKAYEMFSWYFELYSNCVVSRESQLFTMILVRNGQILREDCFKPEI